MQEEEQANQETTEEEAAAESGTVIVDLLRTEETIVITGKGKIHLIHEITLGDVILSILLACILIFMVLNRFISRR